MFDLGHDWVLSPFDKLLLGEGFQLSVLYINLADGIPVQYVLCLS